MQGNPLEWRWVNEKGTHNAVDSRELVDALLAGRMTPHVWVWRTGWTSWVRASQVAELSTAIPKGARLPTVSVAIDPNVVTPPPIPTHTFDSGSYVRRLSTPVPKAMPARQLVRRPAAPTLVDTNESENHASHTLRPPGAVPPPPRTYSGSFSFDVQRAIDQASFLADSNLSTVSVNPDLVMRSVLGEEEPSVAVSLASKRLAEPPPAPLLLGDSFDVVQSAARRKRVILAASAILVVSAVASFAAFSSHTGSKSAAARASATASSSRPALQPCHVVAAAERLTPSIALNVPPVVATAPDGQSIAVGFADTSTSAAGILVNPATRSVRYAFREAGNGRVTSVVPRLQASQLSFAVARDGESFKEARVVPGVHEFKFGQTLEGFSRQSGSENPEIVWPTDIDTPCTGARIATLPGGGHAVTFRQGGKSGSIQVGWLTDDGRSRLAPTALRTDAKSLGNPSIAVSGAKVLVTFAARNADSEPWAVHMALVPNDGAVATAQRLAAVPGGPGGDAIAPVAVGISDGRFILQWSEGVTGHRQVRVQTLDEQLQPWGAAATVSPPDTNAGPGALWVDGNRSVSFFVVNVGKGAELWAAPLLCGG